MMANRFVSSNFEPRWPFCGEHRRTTGKEREGESGKRKNSEKVGARECYIYKTKNCNEIVRLPAVGSINVIDGFSF